MYTDRRMRGMIETQGQDPLLGKIVQRLVDACQPERIYLFGSRARGDGGLTATTTSWWSWPSLMNPRIGALSAPQRVWCLDKAARGVKMNLLRGFFSLIASGSG
jgi:hypothetical protein